MTLPKLRSTVLWLIGDYYVVPGGSGVEKFTCNVGAIGDTGSIPGWENPLEEAMVTHSRVFLPGESHGQWSLADYSPWGRKSQTQLKRLSTVYSDFY